jgi:mRNA-degrading endonuclease RelE of RelBE toxin-antitoxin system
VKYEIRLSHRAERDLDRLDKATQKRMLRRLGQLSEGPYDARLSAPLAGREGLRKSRVGAWRIIFQIQDEELTVFTCEDGKPEDGSHEGNHVPDFPLDEITLYFTDNVILLPSEY